MQPPLSCTMISNTPQGKKNLAMPLPLSHLFPKQKSPRIFNLLSSGKYSSPLIISIALFLYFMSSGQNVHSIPSETSLQIYTGSCKKGKPLPLDIADSINWTSLACRKVLRPSKTGLLKIFLLERVKMHTQDLH